MIPTETLRAPRSKIVFGLAATHDRVNGTSLEILFHGDIDVSMIPDRCLSVHVHVGPNSQIRSKGRIISPSASGSGLV
jgi:hypothetical protein